MNIHFVPVDRSVTIMGLVELPAGTAPAAERDKSEQIPISSIHSLTDYEGESTQWQ
jgi:hypothetical protein